MEKIEVKLEKDNNDFFREWIIKEWQHHNTVDPIYQLRIIKPEELKFKENEEYYKILYNNKMVGFIGGRCGAGAAERPEKAFRERGYAHPDGGRCLCLSCRERGRRSAQGTGLP